jgi:hypothetical protein
MRLYHQDSEHKINASELEMPEDHIHVFRLSRNIDIVVVNNNEELELRIA